MRRKRVYSLVGLALAGAGLLAYHREQASEVVASDPASTIAAHEERHTFGASGPAPSLAPRLARGFDTATMASESATSGERFPDTAVGHQLDQHMLILVDIGPDADAKKEASLQELRKHPKEATAALLDAYHRANPHDEFGRWLLSSTLGELQSNEAYAALVEIAKSPVADELPDNDREGAARSNESAIRQNAVGGIAALAQGGNTDAEKDLVAMALDPPSGDDAVRTLAIKGYLAAGPDYAARVQQLTSQLPAQYHDVITLTVSQPPEPTAPPNLHASR